MKALRRSLKGDKNEVKIHPHHASISPKDAIAIQPPKKVIRALYDYNANPNHEQELSFAKGDFFHVIGRENDTDWYEACNPSMPNARGLVPVRFFQVLGRTERDSAGSNFSITSSRMVDTESGSSDRSGPSVSNGHPGTSTNGQHRISTPASSSTSIGKGSGTMVYGVVMYDFKAERPDELDATEGEAIIVIAQSNPEWFVAKPIGRLGGPGLIPVSFIEIRDMTTQKPVPDPQQAIQRAGVPKVEEWKKMAAEYKNSSITLGRFESGSGQRIQQGMERMSLSNGRHSYQNGPDNGYLGPGHQRVVSGSATMNQSFYSRPSSSQIPAPVSASIPRWLFENNKYWYIIDAVMEDGRRWHLSRTYQDFYDFQISLLQEFPEEAGNTGKLRTLPYMPGPVTFVTHQISTLRRGTLDDYIKKLLTMAPYISRHHLVRQLFAPREGDIQMDPEPQSGRMSYGRLSGDSQPSSNESPESASRQSSQHNLNGGSYQPGLSAPPAKANHQRQQVTISNGVAQAQAVHYRNPSELHRPQGITRQVSSLTQTSNGSQPNVNGPSANGGAVKIKIYYQDDLIAIRVPSDISFEHLREKLQGRLSLAGDIRIQYKDEFTNSYEALENDHHLDIALQRNPSKLTLYVNY
ncbi:MAG: bud emergence protein 1 [Peltula sp. TS41687]|nr:MAG: bud emergence protein 1 [Peltula sp. TS41687]